MRALRICRRCLEHLAETCVWGAIAANQLRGCVIPMAHARKRRDAHGRADETGPGRGRATALSNALENQKRTVLMDPGEESSVGRFRLPLGEFWGL